ncbi:hypothetical protein GGR54DRAFT_626231 [Hypoxylon sp. NC1633]|nr:hypothetical protein GGR54DRAFT_626231 [Hypoxylon sp. NC1633]
MENLQISPRIGQLGDLRSRYAGDLYAQSMVLTKDCPLPYVETEARKSPDWDKELAIGMREVNSLDAAIVVLRHLFERVGTSGREGSDGNPLEAMIWADLADPSTAIEQTKARYLIIKKFCVAYPQKQLSFYNLMENRRMWDTVWQRPAFMFWHKEVLERRKDASDWERVEHKIPRELARDACILYRGKSTMSKHVESYMGAMWSEEMDVWYHWRSNHPVVIRVEYRHDPGNGESKKFEDLSEINIDPQALLNRVDEQGKPYSAYYQHDSERIRYVLTVVVRLGDAQDPKDRVRLYDIYGKPRKCPGSHEMSTRISGSKWTLGEQGQQRASYMLYYTYVSRDLFRVSRREVPLKDSGFSTSLNKIKRDRMLAASKHGQRAAPEPLRQRQAPLGPSAQTTNRNELPTSQGVKRR